MKPSNILYCLLAVCLLSGFPARGQTQPIESKYYYSSSQLGTHYETDTATMEEFVYYTVGDLDLTSQPGAPTLPVQYVRFSVPYNAADITVNASRDYTSLSRYGLRVYPAPQPIPTDGSVQGELPMVIDSTIYNTDAYWPASVAEMVSDGFYLGDNRVITVAVYPIQYNPMNTFLRFNSEIELTISYTLGATPGNILVRRDATLRQQEMNQVKTFVENPNSVESFSTEANITQLAPIQGDPQPQAQYLIIAPDSLASSFKRLAAFKRQKGYTVDVVTVEQIVNDPMYANGDVSIKANQDTISAINDPAGKIREYLKDAYKYRGTQFVLLGGKDVPFRYGYAEGINVPTDFYYSELHSVWVEDSIHQFTINSLDQQPDLSIGRLSCTNSEQILNYESKLFRYELNPGNGVLEYLGRSFFYEGLDLFATSYDARTQFSNIFNDNIFVQEEPMNRYPKAMDLINEWNSTPYSFYHFYNHAAPNQMTIYGAKLKNGKLTRYDKPYLFCLWALQDEIDNYLINIVQNHDSISALNRLKNKEFPALAYSIGCDQMPFDVLSDYAKITMNFGESFTLGKDYGGPAFLGNTRSGYFVYNSSKHYSPCLEADFGRALNAGCYKLGQAEMQSKSRYQGGKNMYMLFVHNLLGDPEFEMWTDTPSAYTSQSVSRTDNTLTVTGIPSGDTTTVAISNGTIQKWLKLTNGSAVFQNINPNSTIMLYRHNYLPWIAPLALQNERVTDDRYIIASDVTAGREVDSNRTAGDFVIAEGTTYEIEHKGTVSLQPGFKVEKGATFSVKPSDY